VRGLYCAILRGLFERKIHRSSDNTNSDIGFTANGDLDTVALKAFVGANNGFVRIWYNQSLIASRDVAETVTNANQPRIVNAGVIDRVNGVPAIFFNNPVGGAFTIGLSSSTPYSVFNGATKQACFNAVAKVSADLTGAYNCIVNKTGTAATNEPCPLDFYYNVTSGNNTSFVGKGTAGGDNGGINFAGTKFNAAAAAMQVWTYQSSSAANTTNVYCNGTNIVVNGSTTNYGDVVSPLWIGKRADAATALNGWVSEVVTFNALPSATDRAFLEYTQGQYFGVAGIALGALPAAAASGFISKWYDQSGGNNHSIQGTAGNQPKIVNAGVINKQGGLSAASFDGASSFLTTTYAVAMDFSGASTTNVVFSKTGAPTSDAAIFDQQYNGGGNNVSNALAWNDNTGTAGVPLSIGYYPTGVGIWQFAPLAVDVTTNTSYIITGAIQSVAANKSTINLFQNGTSISSQANKATVGAQASQNFNIGKRWDLGNYAPMNLQELSTFSSALNTTRRTLIETNQGAYYSLVPSNSKYTVANGYNIFVNGVGRTSAVDSVADTRQSGGMGFIVGMAATDFLKDNGDYMTAGMTCPTATVSLTELPAGCTERWANDWYINKTDVGANNGDIKIYFDFTDYGVASGPTGAASGYQLLGRNAVGATTFSLVPTTTQTISGNRVIFTLPAANLGATGYYTIGSVDYISNNLPVELLSFSGQLNNNKVDLKWATQTETDNKFFTIERSSDGQNFKEYMTKNSNAPHGNSTTKLDYQITDNSPLAGTSYYRLKQTDYNGKNKTFNVVTVDLVKDKHITFIVYPNPNQGEFTVDFTGLENNHEVQILLHDIAGKEVYSSSFFPQNSDASEKIIPKEKIGKGVYFCSLVIEGIKYTVKVIVQ
jgi:hypothetical protein